MKKTALELVNEMIENLKKSEGPSELAGLKATLNEWKSTHTELVKKAESFSGEALRKSADLDKVDPKSRLPGVMLDKNTVNTAPAPAAPKPQANQTPKMMKNDEQTLYTQTDMQGYGKQAVPVNKADGCFSKLKSHLKKCGQTSMMKADDRNQKGVHQSLSDYDKESSGMSQAGLSARVGKDRPDTHWISTERAKESHANKLKELKTMPKPNLPKSEAVEKANGHEQGVHADLKQEGLSTAHSSSAGNDARTSNAARDGKLFYGSTHNQAPKEHSAIYMDSAKEKHRKVLEKLKSMPKPNLPKSEDLNKKVDAKKIKSVLASAAIAAGVGAARSTTVREVPDKKPVGVEQSHDKRDALKFDLKDGKARLTINPDVIKDRAQNALDKLKGSPKPNLPKSEIE